MDVILRFRWLTVFVALLCVFLCGFGVRYLSIDPNNRVFFGEEHANFTDLRNFEATFGSGTNLFFVVSSDSDLFESNELETALRWLADEAWRIDNVVSVDSVVSYPHVEDQGGELAVVGLLDFVCVAGECDPSKRGEFDKTYLKGRYVDSDVKAFSVVAKVDLVDVGEGAILRMSEEAAGLMREFRERFGTLSIYLTGGVPMMNAFFVAAQNDSASLLVIVVLVLAVALYLFLGGLTPTLLMIGLGIASVLTTMGIAGWVGLVINTATATVPLIVFTLVVASAMHLFLHVVREELVDTREGVERAVRAATGSNWRPVLLTASTTAIGLLSMVFVSAPPLRELGILSAVGVAVGAILTLTLVPAVFALLPRIRTSNYLLRVQGLMNRYARWFEVARPRMLGVIVLFVAALVGIARINIDEDFVRYFSETSEFRKDTEHITRLLSGPYNMDVIYDSGASAGVYSAETMVRLKRMISFLRAQPETTNVASFIDVLDEVARVMGGSQELAELPRDVLAQYFLMYELSLGVGQSTTDFLDADHRRARVSVLLDDVSMARIRELVERVREWADLNGLDGSVVVTGEGVPTAYLSSESIREMGLGIAISVLFSAIAVGIYFGSLKACLSIFVATCVPILAGFGVWGWIESDIGMAATLVIATTIGVVIDDTIHLTYRYVDGIKHLDLTPWGATAYSIHKTGTAILVTSIVLVAGLFVLITSEFRMNSTFGTCSSLVIALALLYNLTVAPRVLSEIRQ